MIDYRVAMRNATELCKKAVEQLEAEEVSLLKESMNALSSGDFAGTMSYAVESALIEMQSAKSKGIDVMSDDEFESTLRKLYRIQALGSTRERLESISSKVLDGIFGSSNPNYHAVSHLDGEDSFAKYMNPPVEEDSSMADRTNVAQADEVVDEDSTGFDDSIGSYRESVDDSDSTSKGEYSVDKVNPNSKVRDILSLFDEAGV